MPKQPQPKQPDEGKTMKYETVDSVHDYLNWVDKADGSNMLYRGMSGGWEDFSSSAERRILLNPKIKQKDVTKKVVECMRDIISGVRANGFLSENNDTDSDLKILARMQHDGAATCFVDFTYDPLVALWFACASNKENPADAKVFSMDACVTGIKDVSDDWMTKDIGYFFKSSSASLWKWAPPMSINKRVPVQKSVFLFGRGKINELKHNRIVVSESAKKGIRDALKRKYGVDELALFPDYAGYVYVNARNRAWPFGER